METIAKETKENGQVEKEFNRKDYFKTFLPL